MSDANAKDLYNQYFNCNDSYVLDYIMKFGDQFRLTSIYNSRFDIIEGHVIEPNDLYRIYVSSENDLKDILKGFFIPSLIYDDDRFGEFSDLIKDLIYKLTQKRYPNRELYFTTDDDFVTDDDFRAYDNLSDFRDEFCKYVKPNTTEARMVIQWLILFKVCLNSSIDLEDINDFYFAYDKVKEDLHLFILIKNQVSPRDFVFKISHEKSIINISCWNEKEALPKMKTFDLPLSTIVSEINKFRSNYESIIVKGEDENTESEDVFRDIFKVVVNNETELKNNLKGLEIDDDSESTTTSTKFEKFAEDLKDIIDNITDVGERNTQWFFLSNNGHVEDNVSRFLNQPETKYYKPRILESRLAITWILVYKLCKHYELDRTKIENLDFYYYPIKNFMSIVITIDGKEHNFGCPHAKIKNVLNMFWWHNCTECNAATNNGCVYINKDEKGDTDTTVTAQNNSKESGELVMDFPYQKPSGSEEEDKLISFDLTVNTIVSEINKFRSSYEIIELVGAGDTKYDESMLDDIFRVHIENLEDLKNNISRLRCNGNTTKEKYDKFADDLEQIIHYIFTNPQKQSSYFYFICDYGSKFDNVGYNDGLTRYYKPNISESRMALTWVVIYKLCKKYNLDRTKIRFLTVSYFHKSNILSIFMNVDGENHEFRLPHAKEKSILNLLSWHNCSNCDTDHCVFLEPDEKEEVKDESADLPPFSDFLKKRLVDNWDNAIKNYVQIEGDDFQSDFNVHAVIPLDYIPEEEYNKINEILTDIYELSGQMPIFTVYPKDYCDNYVSPRSFSRFDDDMLVNYDTIESTDFTSLMIILAALEYHWMTKKEVAEWDDPDYFVINKTTSDVFYKQGFACVRHSIINVNNRIIEWHIPGSKDDKIINNGFGSIDSLALIRPTEQKNNKRKKLLKMMLISQMMNNSKK